MTLRAIDSHRSSLGEIYDQGYILFFKIFQNLWFFDHLKELTIFTFIAKLLGAMVQHLLPPFYTFKYVHGKH